MNKILLWVILILQIVIIIMILNPANENFIARKVKESEQSLRNKIDSLDKKINQIRYEVRELNEPEDWNKITNSEFSFKSMDNDKVIIMGKWSFANVIKDADVYLTYWKTKENLQKIEFKRIPKKIEKKKLETDKKKIPLEREGAYYLGELELDPFSKYSYQIEVDLGNTIKTFSPIHIRDEYYQFERISVSFNTVTESLLKQRNNEWGMEVTMSTLNKPVEKALRLKNIKIQIISDGKIIKESYIYQYDEEKGNYNVKTSQIRMLLKDKDDIKNTDIKLSLEYFNNDTYNYILSEKFPDIWRHIKYELNMN